LVECKYFVKYDLVCDSFIRFVMYDNWKSRYRLGYKLKLSLRKLYDP
jgi:hypothetical protein